MLEILEQATLARQQENWSLVSQCLRQLPVKENGSGSQPLEEIECEQALTLALQVLAEGDFQQRWQVAKVFPKLGQGAVAPLLEILEDEEAELEARWFAARTLGQFDQPEVVMTLANLLENTEDEDLEAVAAQALANLGSSAIEALSNLLAKEESRALAVRALSLVRRSETIAPLLSVVDDPLWEIRYTAIEALSSFSDARIRPVLIAALSDTAAAVRKEAAIGVSACALRGEAGDEVSHLKPLLYDLNGEVCQQTAVALGKIGSDEASEALFQVLQSRHTPEALQIVVVKALGWAETVKALDYLQAGLKGTSLAVCREIVTVLGRTESPDLRGFCTQILIEFLYSGEEAAQATAIKQALALSLGELGETEAFDPLLTLAADSQWVVQLHAIAALKKIPNAGQKLQHSLNDKSLSDLKKQGVVIALAEWSKQNSNSKTLDEN
ncbi:MAG: PBS lyase [Cyanobacteria bacterium QH_8_48_120]|jgi:HEAT repeat protein|nr:MAG: PBS lyase [Cyanobacteria bacterium QH_10_48_56]PSO56449.1 MAG: PBS lyase [Cyanobacteria bacterium QH_1_48_107]PSO60470.1 MAG: PBS lyase [Cyanobacteria bacterium QH_2_48_84]PSO61249.1 MAG: PBS lyase [Cyanobacteria bacterium QH_7_48_89]PSO68415.1 MAG: PBS lyase [Cyanobacteria bacterium QH_6_48_35]PSO70877.1 MAG: PBS lyase [Cyanobacteria bacterium QS_1_48_34]PSO71421.1 MAG: PBS lyase [Cyanobacteria bacterium QH_3_48_40]PSO74996.1 MAG: PBS lyase [Cyanobacteria bacterium QH_8_48_120]PSO7